MAVRVIIDRRRCIGAGTCVVLAPSGFQWRQGDFMKPEPLDLTTVDEDLMREVAAACPTQAIVLEAVVDSMDGADVVV